jgi:glycine/D-amino acid oxidase-like deaminating enzyme
MNGALVALEAQVRAEFAKTAHPGAAWLAPKLDPDGRPALDVLVIGAGQSGIATAFGLMRSQVTNILVLDKAEEGREGPWLTYARMHTLRSPKDFTGPDLDIPSLTYQSWHEAQFGEDDWRSIDLIPRALWAEYLLWFRRVVDLPVRNGCEVVEVLPAAGGLLAANVQTAAGIDTLFVRKIVLTTGSGGHGRLDNSRDAAPSAVVDLRAYGATDRLRQLTRQTDCSDRCRRLGVRQCRDGTGGRRGGGASVLPQGGHPGDPALPLAHLSRLPDHFCDLDDAWRWRFMRAILEMREGFPQATYGRCARHANFHRHDGAPIEAAREAGRGVELQTPRGVFPADFVICGTGVDMNFAGRPELQNCAANIAVWADRYQPPTDERSPGLDRFPYLADDYAQMERVAGETPWIADIHVFAIASTMSFGPSGSSINAMTTAVSKLVHGPTRGLFRADIERHWASFRAYDVPQAVVERQTPAMGDGR